ncbi:hypothetical protein [Glaciimonas immobilis]|uniref:Lipoprotein n=1 Tax=Glaciimonas immobilis TaxID=728004 RepID=A0A840RQ82_9BURK|nr:hypothetical protein [Glaciimonas immobilis]MBB5200557.1 hypothetical protein [Glaciimonas immobilis]
MKKLIQVVIIGTLLGSMLSGCIIVPSHRGYYERPYGYGYR